MQCMFNSWSHQVCVMECSLLVKYIKWYRNRQMFQFSTNPRVHILFLPYTARFTPYFKHAMADSEPRKRIERSRYGPSIHSDKKDWTQNGEKIVDSTLIYSLSYDPHSSLRID